MRSSLLLLLPVYLLLAACGGEDAGATMQSAATSQNPAAQLTTIQWLDSAQNYGKINEGQKLAISFRFRNSGNKPLVIESVQPTCGCTVADYPKEPIAPGGEGEITGSFDSNGREGLQRKHITVRTNTDPAQQDVTFEVNVVGRPRNQQQNTSF